ncbi:MAG: ComF family protein [Planctomycetes bacterium]|nr:ComF family protein [Planctomycetota bacterium]
MLELWTGFVDALYPLGCRLCGAALETDTLACAAHPLELDRASPRCGRCAAELPPALPDGELCPDCRRHGRRFERALCIGSYRGGLHDWVLAFKHGGRRDLALPLGALLAERLLEHGAAGLLVPVPLHPLRHFERGYDQAALLAGELARRTRLRKLHALVRTRATRPQGSALSLSRDANVRGAFRVRRLARRAIQGQELWLVDDVSTSGSTADECARVLLHAGAARVGVALVARASSVPGSTSRLP